MDEEFAADTRIEIVAVGRDGAAEFFGTVPDGPGPWYFVRARHDSKSVTLAGPVGTLAELRQVLSDASETKQPILLRELLSRIDLIESRGRVPRSIEGRLVIMSSIAGGIAGVASFVLSLFEHVVNRSRDEPRTTDEKSSNEKLWTPREILKTGLLCRVIPPDPYFWDRRSGRPSLLAFRPGTQISDMPGELIMHLTEFGWPEHLFRVAEQTGAGLCTLEIERILDACPGLRVVFRPTPRERDRTVVENVTVDASRILARIAVVMAPPGSVSTL